jgi:hypothetical protein
MFQNLKRHLMSEVDSGSGTGAAALPSAEPAIVAPQAQGETVTLSRSDLDALVREASKKAADEAVTTVKDSIYADARRKFAGSKKDKAPSADDAATPAQALTASDERMFLRGLDRELAKLGISPNSAQYARAERDLLADRPDDVSGWARDYFDGWGGAKSAPQPATNQAAAPAKPVAEHPVSNRGAPPPAQVPLEELDLYTATDADRAAFLRAKGPKAYADLLRKQGKGRPVRF